MKSRCLIPIAIAAISLYISLVDTKADDGPLPSRSELPTVLVVDADTTRQIATYEIVSRLPVSDNDIVIPWLKENASLLQPMFLYELARRMFAHDHAAALEWYIVAVSRARFDANRCADPAASNSVRLLTGRAEPIPSYLRDHPEELSSAVERALSRPDVFVDKISPMWICGRDLAVYGMRESAAATDPGSAVRPSTEWPAIRDHIRQKMASFAGRPNDSGVQRLVHKGSIVTVAWSPDGKLLATSSFFDGRITLWDVESGRAIREMTREFPRGHVIAFTGDNAHLLTAPAEEGAAYLKDALSIWDLRAATVVGSVEGPQPEMGLFFNRSEVFALSLDRHFLALIPQKDPKRTVTLYETESWRSVKSISTDRSTPKVIAFGPEGTHLAVATHDEWIYLFSLPSGTLLWAMDPYDGFGAGIEALAYSPDGRYIASTAAAPSRRVQQPDGTWKRLELRNPIRVWNAKDGTLAYSYAGPATVVNSIAWSPDSRRLAMASEDHTVRLWEVGSAGDGEVITSFAGSAFSVAFSPDGRRLAAAGDNFAVIVAINGK